MFGRAVVSAGYTAGCHAGKCRPGTPTAKGGMPGAVGGCDRGGDRLAEMKTGMLQWRYTRIRNLRVLQFCKTTRAPVVSCASRDGEERVDFPFSDNADV